MTVVPDAHTTDKDPMPAGRWADLPERRPPAQTRGMAHLVVPIVVVLTLWVIGWRALAIIVAAAATAVAIARAASPRFRAVVDRLFAWVGRTVGQLLTVVLLGAVQLLIFAPVSALARLLRTDPLDPRAGSSGSRWLERDRRDRPVPGRQFANERYRLPGGRPAAGSPGWIRGVLGGLVLLVGADIALGTAFSRLGDDPSSSQPGTASAAPAFDPLAQEALRVQDRSGELLESLDRAGVGDLDPFIGWRFADSYVYETPLVNIHDGARASLASPLDDPATATVWFFGGSTMYGSGQSDDATIPSQLVRLLAESGVAIEATNFGHPAYANWQQVQLLEYRLSRGERPDIVVFYDGFNDLTLQTHFGVHRDPTHLFFGLPAPTPSAEESVATVVREWWADHSAVAQAVERVRDRFDDEPEIVVADTAEGSAIDTVDPVAAAEAAVAIHRQGVDHVTALAEGYGFRTLFFWQPFLYTRAELTPAEQELIGLPGYDTDVWLPMIDHARGLLADPVIDISDATDQEPTSVFWDFVHTNERGAELVAAAIEPHLRAAVAGIGAG